MRGAIAVPAVAVAAAAVIMALCLAAAVPRAEAQPTAPLGTEVPPGLTQYNGDNFGYCVASAGEWMIAVMRNRDVDGAADRTTNEGKRQGMTVFFFLFI